MSRRELKSLTDSGVQVSLERGQQERILRSGNRINKSSSELSCKQEPRRELKSSTGSAVQVSLERGRILRSGNSSVGPQLSPVINYRPRKSVTELRLLRCFLLATPVCCITLSL